jgi:hypothetical protein
LVLLVVAPLIGSVEAQGPIEDRLGLAGGFWDFIAALNDNFGALDHLIVGLFAVSWLASVAFYRFSGYDKIEERAGCWIAAASPSSRSITHPKKSRAGKYLPRGLRDA